MKYKKQLLTTVILLAFGIITSLQAQNLDRVTLSSGGSSTDELSYVIGETFNFALADGDIIIETGTQGSTDDTGGDSNYTTIEQVATQNMVSCYPNPAKDVIYFNLKGKTTKELSVQIFNANGKLLQASGTQYSDIMSCKILNLPAGNYFLTLSNKQGKVFGASKFVKIK